MSLHDSINQGIADFDVLHQIVHGDASTSVIVDSGAVPSVAKTIVGISAKVVSALTASSTTTLSVGLGNKTIDVPTNKAFQTGQNVIIADQTGTNLMFGIVVSYADTTLIVNVIDVIGNGSYSAWTVSFTGPMGKSGMDAYNLAIQNGFVGSLDDWFNSLRGTTGAPGAAGKDGRDGVNGVDGKSAYQLAVDSGYQGSMQDWLTSLKGKDGNSVTIKDTLASQADLPSSATLGDAYIVSGDIWIYGQSGWFNAGQFLGLAGADGRSAYQIALDNGFVGDETIWLASLKGAQGLQGLKGDTGAAGPQGIQGEPGAKGDTGPAGPQGIQGPMGDTGATGAQGPQGVQGDTGAVGPAGPQGIKGDTGATGPQGAQGIQGPSGANGESAYQLAVDQGFVGTQAQWLASLVGPEGLQGQQGPQGLQGATGPQGASGADGAVGPQGPAGANGESAYQLAVDQGFVGTMQQWLASLVGPQGAQGAQGIQGATGAQGTQGPQGAQGPAGIVPALTVVASEALSAGDFVNLYSNNGTLNARRANAATAQRAHGFVLVAVASGGNASVNTIGVNTAVTGQTIGDVFLQPSAGQAGATPPSTTGQIVQNLGTALSATSINFESKLVITL